MAPVLAVGLYAAFGATLHDFSYTFSGFSFSRCSQALRQTSLIQPTL